MEGRLKKCGQIGAMSALNFYFDYSILCFICKKTSSILGGKLGLLGWGALFYFWNGFIGNGDNFYKTICCLVFGAVCGKTAE
ncbi:MAG: hypothetical protein Q4D63_07465 [Neisseria animaloris]|nr:hypothetical protein [Neisseria animaloris]